MLKYKFKTVILLWCPYPYAIIKKLAYIEKIERHYEFIHTFNNIKIRVYLPFTINV